MKKIFSNIRTMAALLMAGAAFAACSSSDDIIENQQPANNGKQAYTLTINASKDGSTTRALDLVGSAVVASWETTDVIHVTKGGTEIGTLSPTNIEGLNATFTGTISEDADINVYDVLTLTYHPVADFATQNGTLSGSATSAENFDMAVATLTISAITGNTITVSESQANFVNQTAVVVLSPYNPSWSEYHSLNSLTVSVTMDIPEVGTVTEKIGPITVTGDQPHYFSLPSQSLLAEVLAAKYSVSASTFTTLLASATITFTGHQTDDDYDREYLTCSKTGYKFAAGKYYKLDNSNFSMTFLHKRAAAGKDVYVSPENDAWSNTVTYAVNSEIGWKVVGDYVFCGDKQLYVVDNSGPEPSEGWVKASDGLIPFGATYTLRTTVTWNSSNVSDLRFWGGAPDGYDSYTKEGITLRGNAEYCDAEWTILGYGEGIMFAMNAPGGYTFTAPDGKKFTKIEITATTYEGWYTYAYFSQLESGWPAGEEAADDFNSTLKFTWTGSAASVNLATTLDSFGPSLASSIEFTLE